MRWFVLSTALFLVGCDGGPYATTSGFIGETEFNDPVTVFHSDEFIVIFDREIDCLDLAWVEANYQPGQSPVDNLDFVGLQFYFKDELDIGTYSVAGDAPVDSFGYSNIGGLFETYRASEGTITIESLGPARDDPTIGNFGVTFKDGSKLAGEFETEWCRNLRAG